MIVAEKVKDLIVIGEDQSKKAKISDNKLAKLQYLLTKGLYKDPITAVIAEWTNNGVDSVVQAGKDPMETPVMVSINKNDKGQYIFSVEDKGVGLDDRDFEDICMNYLESTKDTRDDCIGAFGIGMKSFLSLERSATFTCRKNKVERKYLVYEGAEFVNYNLIYQKETEEENGVLAELVISSWAERESFVAKAISKLAYYDTVVLIVDNTIITNEIYRNELFQTSSQSTCSSLHLCLKDVYYEIDWSALGIARIPMNIALRFNLGDGLTPTPSRESYITNEKTKDLILKRLEKVADWFVTKYNETIKEFETLLDGYEYIGVGNANVMVGKEYYTINSLAAYSKISLGKAKVKGIIFETPLFYKGNITHMLFEYEPIAYLNSYGALKRKTKRGFRLLSKAGHIRDRKVTVLIGDDFKGNVKEFLKERYKKDTLFLKKERNRILGSRYDNQGFESYKSLLNLTIKPKNVWRSRIEEWNLVQSSIVSTFKDETQVGSSKEFLTWLDKRRKDQREARKSGAIKYSKDALSKQTGDVTIAYNYERYDKVHFKKQTFKIKDLGKNKYLSVILTEAEIDEAKPIIVSGVWQNVKFGLVGKLEGKKIPKHYQFINFKTFMTRNCKPFMRLASAIKFQEVLNDLKHIRNYKLGVLKPCLGNLSSNEEKLREYVEKNLKQCDTPTQKRILEVANEYKLYDLSLWDVYKEVKEVTSKYDFLAMIAVPGSYNTELQEKYSKMVHQLLLFRKKYYNDFPEGTVILLPDGTKI